MNKRVFLIFSFFFALSFSGIIFYFFLFTPQNSQAVECCTSPCTTERFAECNSVSTDFCSICSDPSYFYFRCSSIPCTGVCTDFYCDGSCGANCSGIQDPDCSGSCCGDSICNGTENSLTCPGDCPVVCVDIDNDGFGSPVTTACSSSLLDCDDNNSSIKPGMTESCDSIDNNCNGLIDEGCSCLNGATQICGSNVGTCVQGLQTCISGDWGTCVGETVPVTESCDGLDNDCDFNVDEICSCVNGSTQTCGASIGLCQPGVQTCTLGNWGSCLGETAPSIDICDGFDNDCDGMVDEISISSLNDNQNGVCSGSLKNCLGIAGWENDYSGVSNNEWPNETSCTDGLDNDCDGMTDVTDVEDCSTGCLLNSDCDDSNPCSIDTCIAGSCSYTNESNGTQNCGTGCERCWAPNAALTSVCSSWDSDCNNSNDCTIGSCVSDSCSFGNKTISSICLGGTCDGLGTCVATSTSCSDECGIGEKGCINSISKYTCGEAGDGDICLDRINANCNTGETCNSITGNCEVATTTTNIILNIIMPVNATIVSRSPLENYFQASAMGGAFPYTYTWTSDLDGELYSGYLDNFLKNLSVGVHTITLKVDDANGVNKTKIFSLEVLSPLTFYTHIQNVFDGDKFFQGQFYLYSHVSGGVAPLTYEWSSNIDGVIGDRKHLNRNDLSLGNHLITFKITDSTGAIKEDSVNIEITLGMLIGNINISSGMGSGETFELGSKIYFNAWVVGGTAPYSYTWNSDIDGLFGTADFFMLSNLSLGVHTINFVSTDANNDTISKTLTMEIVSPVCYDVDNDGFGVIPSSACLDYRLDCNDNNVAINPGAEEDCTNLIDENCNGYTTDCEIIPILSLPTSDGEVFNRGTSIGIRTSAVGATNIIAYLVSSDGTYTRRYSMYDDGSHNDLASGDGIFGNNFIANPSISSSSDYKINIRVISPGRNDLYENLRILTIKESPPCISMINNGPSNSKLDIVFIADGYTANTMPSFVSKINESVNKLFSISPFDTRQAEINISRVESITDLGCTHPPSSNCSKLNWAATAMVCDSDIIVNLSNKKFRSYAYFSGYATVSAPDSRSGMTFVHELGHAWGQLADEYVESGKPRSVFQINRSLNCDIDSTCSKWLGVIGTGCYNGCMYNTGYYRSINSGIMRSTGANSYGDLNINHMNNQFDNKFRY